MTTLQWIGLGGLGVIALTWAVIWLICQLCWLKSERASRA